MTLIGWRTAIRVGKPKADLFRDLWLLYAQQEVIDLHPLLQLLEKEAAWHFTLSFSSHGMNILLPISAYL